jgi:uncharacterized membrane protein YphA (DoxX/SURF4 family)
MIGVILSAVIALVAVGSGVSKLTKNAKTVTQLSGLGVSPQLMQTAGILEVLGAAGIAIGWFVKPLGVLSLLCLAMYFGSAAGFHVRANDAKNSGPAVVFCVLSLLAAGLLLAR